jgi:predicted amidohydrolase
MNLACAQLCYRGRDVDPGLPRVAANLSYLESFWRRHDLGSRDVGLLAVGEFWLPSPLGPEEYEASAVQMGGEFSELLGGFARAHDCFLVVNVAERVDGLLFDSTVVTDPNGEPVLVYREIAGGLMPESPLVGPVGTAVGAVGTTAERGLGRWVPTVDTELGRLGSVVGSDLLYPEISMALTLAGADVVLHPNKEPSRTAGAWQCLKNARAIEGGYAVLSCNVANSPDHTGTTWSESRGHSRIIDPSGHDLAESGTDGEDLVMASLDPGALREQRRAARFERRLSSPWAEQNSMLFADPGRP